MEKVIEKLQATVDYLVPHLALANSHMVEFFTMNLWKEHVPSNVQMEFELLDPKPESIIQYFEECISLYDNNLSKFLKTCSSFYPESSDGIIIDMDTFINTISCEKPMDNKIVLHNKFMSLKKEHEVEVMSLVASTVSSITSSSHVIDIGDGKGYLSSHLALQYGLKVLGLDSCNSKTIGAAERVNKLQKQQPCVHTNFKCPVEETSMSKSNISFKESTNLTVRPQDSLYKQATLYTSTETDLKRVLMHYFPDERLYKFGIVGLHTCGSLSPVCLKLFKDNKNDATFLINVGCCYNLLEEDGDSSTFPLSNYLNNKKFKLGRNARMLSLQAPSRIYSSKKISESLMFRAVFELLLEEKLDDYNRSDKKVGRIGAKCKNFQEYCKRGLLKLGLDKKVNDKELEELFMKYSHYKPLLEFYFMLRVSLAPVIENIILLDRLLFLLENGLRNSFLVKMFEPSISPRCLGLISIKDDL